MSRTQGSDSSDSEDVVGPFPFPVVPVTSERCGDGFAASRDLLPGELVLRAAPLAAVPKDAAISRVCASCFQRGSCAGGAVAAAAPTAATQAAGIVPGLVLCSGCHAASFCSRCRSSAWVMGRHAEECQALGDLMRMRRKLKGMGGAAGSATHVSSYTSAASQSTAPSKTGRMCRKASDPVAATTTGEDDGGADDGDTTTLRLVLVLACAVARSRRRQGQGGDGQLLPPDDHFGPEDVIQDGVDDLEQLMGDAEQDLAPALQQQFAGACQLLKVVQPVWARASLDAYLRWSTKVHLNEHDICLPLAASTSAGSVQTGSAVGTRAGDSSGKRTRSSVGAKPSGGTVCGPQATVASAAVALLSRPNSEAVGEGLFPSVARLNHSCAPNVKLGYDEFGCLEVRVRAGPRGEGVAVGKELFAAYVNPEAPREVRRRHLHERYGFWCACFACSMGH